MLKVNNLHKDLDNFQLKDMNIELEKGYIMGLIGRNGAGKSSLLKCILGLRKPTSGSIEFLGYDIGENEKLAKDNMGFVLAEDVFEEYNTIEGNAKVYGSFYSRYDHSRFLHLCEEFELEPKKQLKNLSRGQKMKFQYAFALAHDPKLLVLDEPVGSFDPEFQDYFYKSLTDFIADGEHSVILATHITSQLDKMADYITYVADGRVVFSKDKESLTEEYKIVYAEDYKIKLLPNDCIIYKEAERSLMKALVKSVNQIYKDKDYRVEIPSIEEIMYFMDKGNYKGE